MTNKRIFELLESYLAGWQSVPPQLCEQLLAYLDLLLKWNAKTNLTSIRDPEAIVTRHFGESLFAAQHLGDAKTVLDFGSGAGFPGLPIQLLRPELAVTVAESQNKKATFLREVVRTLGLPTEVWSGRVEAMPATRMFDVVTLRAVDDMQTAITAAAARASGAMLVMATGIVPEIVGFSEAKQIPMPGSADRRVTILRRQQNVPRGTF